MTGLLGVEGGGVGGGLFHMSITVTRELNNPAVT